MTAASPEFEAWIASARAADILAAATERGARLRRQGSEHVGPCPACGGTDKFSVNPKKRVFNCGHQGGAGGDVIEMVRHITGCEFVAAVESLTGQSPPRGESRAIDPEVERERRDERRDRDAAREQEERHVRERKISASERLWEAGQPIAGTQADAYLRRRGITLLREQASDLRFIASLAYEGYRDEDDQEGGPLGSFPAMLAAIRDVDGHLIGVHRTYLAPDEPKKLVPPGDRSRNKAKKVLGNAKHGAIWLGPPNDVIALAEGIETALSWYALALGPDPITLVSAISLGNLAGSSLGTLPHPKLASRHIQDGRPDPEKPGVRLPGTVREIIVLGDGDSDAARTRSFLLTAGARFRAEGRTVAVCMAPPGKDFNDVLLEQGAA